MLGVSDSAYNTASEVIPFITSIGCVAAGAALQYSAVKNAFSGAEAVNNFNKNNAQAESEAYERTISNGTDVFTINPSESVRSGSYEPLSEAVAGDNIGASLKGGSNPVESSGRKFWTNKVEHNGTKVYQRNDIIDPNRVDKMGRTNIERMEQGLAPLGSDGKSVNLHHMTQTNDSAIAEVTQRFHQQNKGIIHINPNTIPSGIDRNIFNSWRKSYWKNRVNDFK